ncbi:MAG: hypothetical protein U0X40_10220 [Ferruginibacter sp.]
MTSGWKIFIVLNVIEAILASLIFGIGLLSNPVHLNKAGDFYFLGFLTGMTAVINLNCISNIFLAFRHRDARKLTKGRKYFFWIRTLLYTGILLMFILLLNEFMNRLSVAAPRRESDTKAGLIILFIYLIPGLMLLVFQLILYFKTLKKIRRQQEVTIDAIGFPGG